MGFGAGVKTGSGARAQAGLKPWSSPGDWTFRGVGGSTVSLGAAAAGVRSKLWGAYAAKALVVLPRVFRMGGIVWEGVWDAAECGGAGVFAWGGRGGSRVGGREDQQKLPPLGMGE